MKWLLTFGRNAQLIWALVLPAFLLLIPLVVVIDYVLPLYPDSRDTLLLSATFLYILLDVAITLVLVKASTAQVEIGMEANSLVFQFKKGIIFHLKDFSLRFSEIKNLSVDHDKGYDFLYFETQGVPYRKFFIRAKEGNPDFEAFKNEMLLKKDDFNTSILVKGIIANKNIYQQWPMKLLAFSCITAWLVIPIAMGFIEFNWMVLGKYLIFLLLSFPIVYKVFRHNSNQA